MSDEDPCALCGRNRELTFHHLIPRTCHSNQWFLKRYSRHEMRQRGTMVCRPCHTFIHQQYGEKELGRRFNTLETLQAEPVVQRFVAWTRRQSS